MKTSIGRAAITAAVIALAACSGNKEEAGAGEEGGRPVASAGTGSGEQAAEAAPGCPPPARKDLAGPDILGIKLGMSHEQALAATRCALGADAVVKSEKRWFNRLDTQGVQLGPQSFLAKQGDSRPCNYAREWQECEGKLKWERLGEAVSVATPGAPGKEQAVAIWRSQYFQEGKMPTVDATVAALEAKYGKPQAIESQGDSGYYKFAGSRELQWVQASNGAPLSDPNPMFALCRNGISGTADGSNNVSWREGCGLNITATLNLHRANPALVSELHVRMVDQGRLLAHAKATEEELRRQGDARRAEEVRQAGGASDVRL